MITFDWLAILLALTAYVMKKWWDSVHELTSARRSAYPQYFEAYHNYIVSFGVGRAEHSDPKKFLTEILIREPAFLLHASYEAMVMSDFLFRECLELLKLWESAVDQDQLHVKAVSVQKHLNALRELMKEEMYPSSPRFIWEKSRLKRRWQKHMKTHGIEKGLSD